MKMIKRLSVFLLVAVAFVTLIGCAPKDQAAAKTKLEEAGYVVLVDTKVQPAAYKLIGVNGVESVITATKKGEEKTDSVYAVFFTEKAQAKDAFSKLEEEAKKAGEEMEIKQSGNWVYYGTAQGMKDFN